MLQKDALATAPVARLYPKIALPCVVTMVANGTANLLQTVLAAPLGQESVAALGIVFSALTLLQAVGYAIALGGCTLFSPAFSTENREEYAPVSQATVWLDLTAGVILGALGFAFAPRLVIWLGATESLAPLCLAYARPLFLSAPFLCGNYALSSLMRCVGKSAAAMVGLTAGTAVTVLLTVLLFRGTEAGLGGGGWAFLAGQGVSFGVLWLWCLKAEELSLKFPRKPRNLFTRIPCYGISGLVRQGFASVSFMLLNRFGATYGTETVAALSFANRITGFCYWALLGWGQGFAPIGGIAFGKKDWIRLKTALSFGYKTALLGTGLLGFAICLFAFSQNSQVKVLLLSQGLTLPLTPLAVFVTYGFQTLKKPLPATLLSCLRQGAALIPLLFLLPRFWGVKGLLIAQGVADLITFLACLIPYHLLFRKISGIMGKNTADFFCLR